MLRSDAQIRSHKVDNMIDNINSINTEVIARIEKDLDPCDVISLVFLLYNVPDTALQRLIIYQRLSQDLVERNSNLLYEWAMHVQRQATPTWKYEFLEALATCQLYGVIRKLGFRPENVKQHFLPNNVHTSHHINPMKKALYKLCENFTADNLCKLSKTLETYEIETSEYKTSELVLLELMCQKFIIVNESSKIDKLSVGKYNIDKLAKIIKVFPGMDDWADELKTIQSELNNEPTPTSSATDTPNTSSPKKGKEKEPGEKVFKSDFDDIFSYIEQNDNENGTLKSDTKKPMHGAYIIKNPARLGVCYIINMEKFHPSKQSIEGNFESQPLERRAGTDKDKTKLYDTMSALKFDVISHDDLNHKQMIKHIKDIIKFRVQYDDSMFMLCIMSHGVKGYVYAADSVLVKIDDIQSVIDEGFKERQMEIPKVMILQVCRVKETNEKMDVKLVADSPKEYYLNKLNFLVCWATASELEAYRDEQKGSIFIQYLCRKIQQYAKQDHLLDIFTTVTNGVANLCTKLRKDQVPTTESTLRKKLYLYSL